jgi:hypothetical protein
LWDDHHHPGGLQQLTDERLDFLAKTRLCGLRNMAQERGRAVASVDRGNEIPRGAKFPRESQLTLYLGGKRFLKPFVDLGSDGLQVSITLGPRDEIEPVAESKRRGLIPAEATQNGERVALGKLWAPSLLSLEALDPSWASFARELECRIEINERFSQAPFGLETPRRVDQPANRLILQRIILAPKEFHGASSQDQHEQ